jgi:hypothetical protein
MPKSLLHPGWAVTLWVLLLWPGTALAQSPGLLRGVVLDDGGTPLPGVTLNVSNPELGVPDRGAVSDKSGAFQVASLPAGPDYRVRGSFPGYATVEFTDLEVSAGRVTTLRIILQPESKLRERVEVRAHPQVVDLDETTTQTRITSEFIDALPILGRNYQDVLSLAPGVTDTDGDGNPNIHGARDTDVITLVDGVSTSDPLTGKIGAQLNIDSIQEIEIKTSGATAEFSRAQGGFANIITKSGGNEFKGTFKFFWRGDTLDGDGAGTDDPRLHGGLGELGLRDLSFNDFTPFLSLEGPIVRDRAWFFMAHEYIQLEEPINTVNSAFVAGTREFREFAKLTWQATPNNRLALSINYDPQKYLNEGLNSFTAEESGYTEHVGGTILTLRSTVIMNPYVALETTASAFDERPDRHSNISPDGNGNGILYFDRNGNGFPELNERDYGEDFDNDGAFDVFEPILVDDGFRYHDDIDGDGERTLAGECEGNYREDFDCDGAIDPGEDRNQNGRLDDVPHPTGPYPYGHLVPEGRDQDYLLDRQTGLITGPYYQDFADSRRRFTLRQDLSVFVPDFRGSHDVKVGWAAEREVFDRDTTSRNIVAEYVPPYPYTKVHYDPTSPRYGTCFPCPDPIIVSALLPVQGQASKGATGFTAGLYVQDNYKPLPNLSLGMGLRLDQEIANASGYTFFDPGPARATFDRLGALIGNERNLEDLQLGDNNGIQSHGIMDDPLFQPGPEARLADVTDPIRAAMVRLFIRNHADVEFGTNAIAFLIPDVMRNGKVDPELLSEKGVIAQEPERFTLSNSNLAPRLSLSWDPAANGKSKLFATWGRYFDKLFLSTVSAEEGPDQVIRYYKFDNKSVRNRIEPNKQIGGPISTTPPSVNQVDRGLQTPFSDELTLGFEREIAPEVALSVTYIDRRYRQQLQDVDVNHYLRINPLTGQPLDVLGRIDRIKPPSTLGFSFERSNDGRPDLYLYNFYFNQILRVGNFNEARYRAIEVELRRRLARRWELQASYSYSRAVGAAEDFQSRLGNDPSTTEFEFGYLDYDQRHVVKLNGVTFLPKDWQLGASATWSSGLPYSVISRFFASDNADYQQFRTRFGYTLIRSGEETRFIPVRRNSGRNEASLDINLRARKAVVIGRTAASLFFEVFNVLNTDDLRIRTYEPTPDITQITQDDRSPQGPVLQGPLDVRSQGHLQIDATRRFGRRFQIGFQIEF